VDGVRFDWGPGDSFVVPSWSTVDHEASELADLFAISDRPVLVALHLYREEVLAEAQRIERTFVSSKDLEHTTDESGQEQ
jgi:gentisate 1,2-dioxygenase